MARTLDQVIESILTSANKSLSVKEITKIINDHKLWLRPSDKKLPKSTQVSARINNYKHKFTREDGLISLNKYSSNKDIQKNQRISRLTFNTNGWVQPSGEVGKSKFKKSHEARFGYGHEEWLFDTSKLIDGYHYSFLEPVRKQQDAYSHNYYDVWLYTINDITKVRYWVGQINEVYVLNQEEAEKIKNIYIKMGWFEEMKNQIVASGANPKGFSDWKGVDLFNIKFLPKNVILNDPHIELSKAHPIYKQSRYSFSNYNQEFEKLLNKEKGFKFITSDHLKAEEENLGIKTKTHIRPTKLVEINYLHEAISKQLTKKLIGIHGKENVTPEHPAGYGSSRIDIVVKNRDVFQFYEIKTYPTLRSSIREAIGQLMEYSFWQNCNNASELIIVTQPHFDFEKAKVYFAHLRKILNIPLFYQSFDIESGELTEKV